ncbi:transferrin-like [Cloeon dipterum]|uniref:transferrin-like n=1 Tax=Cloeon dipterum TaxID=197152 RepID=UPI00321FBF0C
MANPALVAGFLLLVAANLAYSQAPDQKFKICVLKTKTRECNNLDRAGSGVECVPVEDSTDCALKMRERKAHFGMFKAEEALLASHILEAVNVIGDIRHEEYIHENFSFNAVAIARRSSVPNNDLQYAQNLSLCHPGMGQVHTGWSDMILKELDLTLLDKKGLLKCDEWRSTLQNELYSISQMWGPSCRPGKWSWDEEIDASLKKDFNSLCAKCPNKANCAYTDPGNTHQATIACLRNGGDVAYVALQEAKEFFQSTEGSYKDFGYVCKDLKLSSNYSDECILARQPWSSIVAVREVSRELGAKLHEWLKPLEPRLSIEQVPERMEGGWQRTLIDLLLESYHLYSPLPQIELKTFVGRGRRLKQKQEENVACNRQIRWCVGREEERAKCGWISTAAWYAGLVPEIKCVYANGSRDCVNKVSSSEADLTVADIDLAHYGKSIKKLKTLRFVETSDADLSSIVAIVKKDSDVTKLSELKDKKACFPSYEGIAFGTFLKEGVEQSLINKDTCPYGESVSEFFGDSCIPGAKDDGEQNPSICAACENKNCPSPSTNSSENDVNAMKCLARDGDVSFVRLYEILKAFETNLLELSSQANYEVLCKEGSKVPLNAQAVKCTLATVPSHAVLAKQDDELNHERDANIVLSGLDSLFGLEETALQPQPPFYMYHPFGNNPNLIFPKSASSLMTTKSNNKNVEQFLKLVGSVPRPCGIRSSGFALKSSFVSLALTLIAFILFR